MATDVDRTKKNAMLLKPKKVELSGPQRAFIMRYLSRTPQKAWTEEERDLYTKVSTNLGSPNASRKPEPTNKKKK